jgi:hypothetical protein
MLFGKHLMLHREKTARASRESLRIAGKPWGFKAEQSAALDGKLTPA